MEKARWSELLFAIWVTLSICWSGTACVISIMCPPFAQGERAFKYVGKLPENAEKEAKLDKIEWCEKWLGFLALGSIAIALLGVVVFFRRGCAVFALAAAIVFACFVASSAIYPFN
jgi:hypothetical protein